MQQSTVWCLLLVLLFTNGWVGKASGQSKTDYENWLTNSKVKRWQPVRNRKEVPAPGDCRYEFQKACYLFVVYVYRSVWQPVATVKWRLDLDPDVTSNNHLILVIGDVRVQVWSFSPDRKTLRLQLKSWPSALSLQ